MENSGKSARASELNGQQKNLYPTYMKLPDFLSLWLSFDHMRKELTSKIGRLHKMIVFGAFKKGSKCTLGGYN
ncbi:hypothetical protein C5167_006853 [Papaver somniferum]|uniref:Uncharacterized protein n=1 Tax=Papaver somniferum TaxID=3469 RepID=A0A4Y7JEN6_PAPSO|nr:hypothetical protein C5167_006853 [Papaver somniferum]